MDKETIFNELEYIYKRPDYNRMNLESEILNRCNGNGTILKEVLYMVKEYRDELDMDY